MARSNIWVSKVFRHLEEHKWGSIKKTEPFEPGMHHGRLVHVLVQQLNEDLL